MTVVRRLGAVLFDLYGTLLEIRVDEEAPAFWDRLAEFARNRELLFLSGEQLKSRFERSREEAVRQLGSGFALGETLASMLRTGPKKPEESTIALFAREFRTLSTKSIRLRRYTIPLLRRLKATGLKLGLVSNTEALFTQHDLERVQLERWFDVVLLSSELGVAKPDPRIFETALRELGVPRQEALFVGDNWAEDIEGGLKAGLRCLYLARQRSERANLPAPNTVLVARPNLETIIRGLRTLGWDERNRFGNKE